MSSIIKVDQIQLANGSTPTAGDLGLNTTGSVLQVVQGYSTSTNLYINSTSYVALPLEASITPASTSSKVLVQVAFSMAQDDQDGARALTKLVRDSSPLTEEITNEESASAAGLFNHVAMNYLDTPLTTNQVTYKVFGKTDNSNSDYRLLWERATIEDTDRWKKSVTITLTEIAG